MKTKTQCAFFSVVLYCLFVGQTGQASEQICDLNEQKAKRQDSIELIRMKSMQEVFGGELEGIEERSWLKKLRLVVFEFGGTTFEASTYLCDRRREVSYPKYRGTAWLVEVPSGAAAEILVIRDAFAELVRETPERYEAAGKLILDLEEGREFRVESTLSFLVSARDLLYPESQGRKLRLAVSGPYWKVAKYGEGVIGFLRTSRNEDRANQEYEEFSARHILCIEEGKVGLIRVSRGGDGKRNVEEARKRAERCTDGIQVGPNYLEYDGQKSHAGIGGVSLSPERRNVLVQLGENGKEDRLLLLSTTTPISAFDAMVLIAEVGKMVGENVVVKWAVGLADGQLLNGPAVFDDESMTMFTESDRPAGAYLVFYEPLVKEGE